MHYKTDKGSGDYQKLSTTATVININYSPVPQEPLSEFSAITFKINPYIEKISGDLHAWVLKSFQKFYFFPFLPVLPP